MSNAQATATATAGNGGLGAVVLSGIFALLKVNNVAPFATWDWIWVFAPLWIGFALFILFVIGLILFVVIGLFVEDQQLKRDRAKKVADARASLEKRR